MALCCHGDWKLCSSYAGCLLSPTSCNSSRAKGFLLSGNMNLKDCFIWCMRDECHSFRDSETQCRERTGICVLKLPVTVTLGLWICGCFVLSLLSTLHPRERGHGMLSMHLLPAVKEAITMCLIKFSWPLWICDYAQAVCVLPTLSHLTLPEIMKWILLFQWMY